MILKVLHGTLMKEQVAILLNACWIKLIAGHILLNRMLEQSNHEYVAHEYARWQYAIQV
jgi:hypothetical protein